MGIPLPMILGSTPDSIQSADHETETQESTKENRFIWRFRDTVKPGLHVTVIPTCINEQSDLWEWEIEITGVKWDGEDFVEDSRPTASNTQSSFNDAIACAEQTTQEVCRNNEQYSHIL